MFQMMFVNSRVPGKPLGSFGPTQTSTLLNKCAVIHRPETSCWGMHMYNNCIYTYIFTVYIYIYISLYIYIYIYTYILHTCIYTWTFEQICNFQVYDSIIERLARSVSIDAVCIAWTCIICIVFMCIYIYTR